MNTYKVIVCGSAGSGKSTFVGRLCTGEYTKSYVPTINVEIYSLRFNTNKGEICFNVWDVAGNPQFAGLRQSHFLDAQAVLIFGNLVNPNAASLYEYLPLVNEDIPCILCGNKMDLSTVITREKFIEIAHSIGLPYYIISSKNNRNIEKPWLHLTRQFLGEDTNFIPNDPVDPPLVTI